jgi:hypothetical protein
VTFVGAGFFLSCVLGAIAVLGLLVYVSRTIRADRMSGAGGLDRLDKLRWESWTALIGWPPWTCWRGCADLHGDDWWRAYLHRTCWDGCADLHREDWWRAYVDQPDCAEKSPQDAKPRTTTNTPPVLSDDLARVPCRRPSSFSDLIG